jgi:radical SAM/Cys-rich protein
MSRETMHAVEAFAGRGGFPVIDITGGAPELVPGIVGFLERLAPLAPRIIFRSNLTALAERTDLVDVLARLRVAIVASFPSLSASQTDSQRGDGVFETSLATLKALNAAGYGQEGTGLELDLVSNPAGAFLPPGQAPAEARFHRELVRTRGITFNHLYTFANVPLGRFRAWLASSGNLEGYLRRLAEGFNPCTVGGLMCRNLVSVSWDGVLYDCDFNQMLALSVDHGAPKTLDGLLASGSLARRVSTGRHCFGCTAGAGSSCTGALSQARQCRCAPDRRRRRPIESASPCPRTVR